MRGIAIGDDVYSHRFQLFSRVEEVFPAAVCVKLASLHHERYFELVISPQLWRADDIENLSVCRYCGRRDELIQEFETGIPLRVCAQCCPVPPESAVREVGSWL